MASVGKKVARGEVLLTLEAMKMQASVHADIDGRVAEILTERGAQVDAKDLLLVLD
jgi:pyruvate carboxylase